MDHDSVAPAACPSGIRCHEEVFLGRGEGIIGSWWRLTASPMEEGSQPAGRAQNCAPSRLETVFRAALPRQE